MADHRFDTLVKHFYVLKTRRESLRLFPASLAAGALGLLSVEEAAAHCKRRHALCRQSPQCCSGRCLNRKRLKKKNGERTKHKIGRCDCSTLQQHCHISDDCCENEQACGDTGCDDHPVCCKPAGATCEGDCDCCGDNVCGEESGECEAQFCSDTQEECQFTSECCNDDEICDANDLDECDREIGQMVCCGTAGSECGEDCDCCVPFQCDEDLGECVAPACSGTGESCTVPGPDGCCMTADVCSTSVCNGGVEVVCCHPSGPCDDDCDCCGPVECINGACGGSQ